eukprot:NODE_6718_length_506_cov_31.722955_g6552_i0.p1 GENE.NODE_6718_length_506_cov_31.722955_g6552_i0~~NODE_6718_length_506_cov_31.722955_g6552_i0.p1  ORF type:complete len:121 (-),score=6.46 NODE_6718_length_506_cov_31.722955_g6552_i0:69-431(-)
MSHKKGSAVSCLLPQTTPPIDWQGSPEEELVVYRSLALFPPFAEFLPWSCLNAAAAFQEARGVAVPPQAIEQRCRQLWELDTLSSQITFHKPGPFALPTGFDCPPKHHAPAARCSFNAAI